MIMNCFYCKNVLEHNKAVVTIELDNCLIVIKDVPTETCMKCGQRSYSDEVAAQIEKITDSVRNTFTEIAVVQYSTNHVA